MSATVLLLPGWHNSGPGHWQSLWEQSHDYTRVQQHDWDFPLRGDWMAQLESAVLAHEQVVLVAHSLGCILATAWAQHSQHTRRVKAALLVAPADVERAEMQHMLHSWSPIARERLPFPSVVVASRDDVYCSFLRASRLAHDWGARLVDVGHCGHINTESQLGDWPLGHALLTELLSSKEYAHGH
jgi:predicted alpha/beta hydrolase family esterase